MPNKVYLGDDGFVHNDYEGDQSAESVKKVVVETIELLDEAYKTGKRRRIIVDLKKLGKSTAESRKVSAEALSQLTYERIALFGANVLMKTLANFIITASGKGSRVKYFDNYEQAAGWLKE